MTRSEEYPQPGPRIEAAEDQTGYFQTCVKPNEQQQQQQEQQQQQHHQEQPLSHDPKDSSSLHFLASPVKVSSATPTHSPTRLSPTWPVSLSPTSATTPSVAITTAAVEISGTPLASPLAAAVPSSPLAGIFFTNSPHEHDLVPPPSPTPPRRVSSPGILSSQADTSMRSPPSPTASTRRGSRLLLGALEPNDNGHHSHEHSTLTHSGPAASGFRRLSAPRLVDVPMLSPDSSQLGKHPKTPSPDEPRSRTKGIKTLSGKALDTPLKMPDFSLPDESGLDRSKPLLSPIPRSRLGLMSSMSPTNGTPKKGLFSEEISRLSSKGHLPRHTATINDASNPFLHIPEKRELVKGDYLTSSQWHSEQAHHLTKKYLEALFRQDRVVMFADEDMEASVDEYLEQQHHITRPFLSNGEFSDVIRVVDKLTGVASVVKRLKKTVHGAMERKRYLNEVRNLWRVVPNANIVGLLDAWEQRGRIFMKMELCEYGSLHAVMMDHKLQGGLSEDIIWRCLADLAQGLKCIHDKNILHLDFKPANVFIDSKGVIKIGDFGHSCERPVLDTDGKEGDRCYMAQELLQGHCDYYSDIFSLGATIFEMASNRVGDLPGEGPEWHRIRDGDLDFDLLLSSKWDPHALPVVLPIISPPPEPSLSQEMANSTVQSTFSDSAPSNPPSTAAVPQPLPRKAASLKFSQALLDVIADMMQPAFKLRPFAHNILANPRLIHAFPTTLDSNGLGTAGPREGALASLLKPSYSVC